MTTVVRVFVFRMSQLTQQAGKGLDDISYSHLQFLLHSGSLILVEFQSGSDLRLYYNYVSDSYLRTLPLSLARDTSQLTLGARLFPIEYLTQIGNHTRMRYSMLPRNSS
jgi:hypothetical protein